MKIEEKLSEMIKVETISSRTNFDFEKFKKFKKVLMELFPLVFEKGEVHDFDGSLLIIFKNDESFKNLLLMSHQDVVSVNGEWQYDPFSGLIKDGLVHGRGSVDTKASLMCILEACNSLLEKGHAFQNNLYIASSNTEEFGGPGAGYIVDYLVENNVHIDLLLDEGGMVVEDPLASAKGKFAMIGVLEKGYADLEFIARSKGGHSSHPAKNEAVFRLANFIYDVERNDPFKIKFNETYKEMFKRLAKTMKPVDKFIFSNFSLTGWLIKRLLPKTSVKGLAMTKTSICFTMLEGSEGFNVAPTIAKLGANMRMSHHEPNDYSIKLITDIAKKYDIETKVVFSYDPSPVVDYNSNEFKLVEKVLNEVYHEAMAVPYIMTGATDARFFSKVTNNALRFAPLFVTKEQLDSIHSVNENINVDTLYQGLEFYQKIIQQFK